MEVHKNNLQLQEETGCLHQVKLSKPELDVLDIQIPVPTVLLRFQSLSMMICSWIEIFGKPNKANDEKQGEKVVDSDRLQCCE